MVNADTEYTLKMLIKQKNSAKYSANRQLPCSAVRAAVMVNFELVLNLKGVRSVSSMLPLYFSLSLYPQ